MKRKQRNRLGVLILTAIVLAAFFALGTSAGIATSPLGVLGRTPLAGLGSCPLGTQGSGSLEMAD